MTKRRTVTRQERTLEPAKKVEPPKPEPNQPQPEPPTATAIEKPAEPMPPTKQPKQKDGLDQVRINELFAKNLEEMKRWYRRQSSGHDVDAYVVIEVILNDVSHAWALAIQGKLWEPPA